MTAPLRKFVFVPFVLLGRGAAFGVVWILLAVAKGNNSVLRKKLAIGALSLTLSV